MKTMITFLLVFLICNYLYPQTADSSSGINSNLFALCPHSSEITVNFFESETAAGASGCFIDSTAPSLSVTILYASSQESKFCALSHTSRSFNTRSSGGVWLTVSQERTISIRNMAQIIGRGDLSSFLLTHPGGKSVKEITSSDIPSKKSPVLAGVLSLFLPGTGQAYNGQWIKAGIQWTLLAGSLYMAVADVNFESDGEPLPPLSIAGIAVGGATWLWSVIDAPVSANQINKERNRALKKHDMSGGLGVSVRF